MSSNNTALLLISGAVILYLLTRGKSDSFYEQLTLVPPPVPQMPPLDPVVLSSPPNPALPVPVVPQPSVVGAQPYAPPNDFASPSDNLTLDVNINDPKNSRFALQAPEGGRPKLTSADLLPGYSSEKWFDNPDIGVKVEDANLMADAVTKVGVDTVGQTKKNPAYDIRGTIPCPKFVVSPWMNSTIEPDINLKSLY